MNNKKYILLQILFVFGIVLFSLMDIYLYKNGYFEEKKITLKYNESGPDVDYKVYLKENDFFDKKYLTKEDNKTFITSLIDYINIEYNYVMQFDTKVNANYKYYIVATLEANKNNSESNYWSKDYRITDEKSYELKNINEYVIHNNVDVDYNKYNGILGSFKKTLNLNGSSGVLKVYMVINSEVSGNGIETPIESKLLLVKLPLTEMTIDASVETLPSDNVKEISKVIDSNRVQIMKSIGYIYVGAVIVCIILLIYISNRKKNANRYESELKKILNTYDSIIVNVKKLPDLTGYKVIDVLNFNELLDAHGEVRMPINYYRDEYRSFFILLNDKTAWRFVMSRIRIERK